MTYALCSNAITLTSSPQYLKRLADCKQKTKRGAQRPPERNIMILTETFSGRFLCVVKTTPEKLLKAMESTNGIKLLSSILPDFEEIDPYNKFSVDFRPVNSGRAGEVTISWSIEIYGDDGMFELTLTKHPPEWS